MLWMLWAAKEAAFKAAVKLKPGTAFIPRAYAVALADPSRSDDRREDAPSSVSIASGGGDDGFFSGRGAVVTPAGPVDFSCSRSDGHVHCVAVMNGTYRMVPPASDVRAVERKLNGPADPSSALRWEAIHYLASALRISPFFIRIRREKMCAEYGPPRVFMEGRLTDIDISLSHDGRYIAFAVHLPGAGHASERAAASARFF